MKEIKDIIPLLDTYVLAFQDATTSTCQYGRMSFINRHTCEIRKKKFFLVCKDQASEVFFQKMIEELFNSCDSVKFNKLNFPENLMDIIINVIENRNIGYSIEIVPSVLYPVPKLHKVFNTISVKHLLILGNDFSYDQYKQNDIRSSVESYGIDEPEFQILKELCMYCTSNENIKHVRIYEVSNQQFQVLRQLYSNLKPRRYKEESSLIGVHVNSEYYEAICELPIKTARIYILPKTPSSLQSIIRAQYFGNASIDEIKATHYNLPQYLGQAKENIMK